MRWAGIFCFIISEETLNLMDEISEKIYLFLFSFLKFMLLRTEPRNRKVYNLVLRKVFMIGKINIDMGLKKNKMINADKKKRRILMLAWRDLGNLRRGGGEVK